MKLLEETGSSDLATVFVASLDDSELVEFVESVQPPVPMDEKLVFIVSTIANVRGDSAIGGFVDPSHPVLG